MTDQENILEVLGESNSADTSRGADSEAPAWSWLGCKLCKFEQSAYGSHLVTMCPAHQKICDLSEDLAMERQINKSLSRMIAEVCEIIGAGDDDNPATVARERMEEIKALDDALTDLQASVHRDDGEEGTKI